MSHCDRSKYGSIGHVLLTIHSLPPHSHPTSNELKQMQTSTKQTNSHGCETNRGDACMCHCITTGCLLLPPPPLPCTAMMCSQPAASHLVQGHQRRRWRGRRRERRECREARGEDRDHYPVSPTPPPPLPSLFNLFLVIFIILSYANYFNEKKGVFFEIVWI